jgi:aminoglycoside 6'-N-acetyltransferase
VSQEYTFRSVVRSDIPRLNEWLRTPEVVRWWGDPEEQAALLRADLLQADLDEPCMVMRIVSYEGRPFGYVQDYDVHVWPQPHFNHLPAGSRAIEMWTTSGLQKGGLLWRRLVETGARPVILMTFAE